MVRIIGTDYEKAYAHLNQQERLHCYAANIKLVWVLWHRQILHGRN